MAQLDDYGDLDFGASLATAGHQTDRDLSEGGPWSRSDEFFPLSPYEWERWTRTMENMQKPSYRRDFLRRRVSDQVAMLPPIPEQVFFRTLRAQREADKANGVPDEHQQDIAIWDGADSEFAQEAGWRWKWWHEEVVPLRRHIKFARASDAPPESDGVRRPGIWVGPILGSRNEGVAQW